MKRLFLSLCLLLAFHAGRAAEEDSGSPLAEIHRVWELRCGKDLGKGASALTNLNRRLTPLVPEDPTVPANIAVTDAWAHLPEAAKAWESLAECLRRYNEMAWNWRSEKDPSMDAESGGVIDALYMPRLPIGPERWEAVRPLILPLKVTSAKADAAPWDERARVKQRRENEESNAGLEMLGWGDPNGDNPEWKKRDGRWVYDFSLLQLWNAKPLPQGIAQDSVRADWLDLETGASALKNWTGKEFSNETKLFRGQYAWGIEEVPAFTGLSSRPEEVARRIFPEPVNSADGQLQILKIKEALLETVACTIDLAGGAECAPNAKKWLLGGSHANPPWTFFQPEVHDGSVRAIFARPDYSVPKCASDLGCQLVCQVKAFHSDWTWDPVPQSWSGAMPEPNTTVASESTDSNLASSLEPRDLSAANPVNFDGVWPLICDWAAAEASSRLAGAAAKPLPPVTKKWWLAFPVTVLGSALEKKGVALSESGMPIECIFQETKVGDGANVVLLCGGAEIARRTVRITGDWPGTWATQKWTFWPGLAVVIAGCIGFLIRRKSLQRFRAESWTAFLFKEMVAVTLVLVASGCGLALVLLVLGPRINEHPESMSGKYRFVLPAHAAVPKTIRNLYCEAVMKSFIRLTGSESRESWRTRFVRTIRCGLFLERPARPAIAAQDATWELAPAGDGTRQRTVEGLFRAANEGDLTRELDKWQWDGLGPSELTDPGAGANVTLVCTDGDPGAILAAPPSGRGEEPVVALWTPDPPRDSRTKTETAFRECVMRLKKTSTVCVSAMHTSLDQEAAPLDSAIRNPQLEIGEGEAASKKPEDLEVRRGHWWDSLTATEIHPLALETAQTVAGELQRGASSAGGAPRLTSRLSGVWSWVFVTVAAIAAGFLGARTIDRLRAFLDYIFPPKKFGKLRLAPALGFGAGFVIVCFLLAALLAASLEPLVFTWGEPPQAASRFASLGALVFLGASILIYLATRGSAKAPSAGNQAFDAGRFLAAVLGALLICSTLVSAAILPLATPATAFPWLRSYSVVLLLLTAAWVFGLSTLAYAASPRRSRRRK